MANPTWTRDELILALDLYIREPSARGNKTHPQIFALSKLLNELPIHPRNTAQAKFRNPNGVSMTLNTFIRYDRSHEGVGLRGAKLAQDVWNDFAEYPEKLAAVADAIKTNYIGIATVDNPTEEGDEEAEEGRLLTRLHRIRERNVDLINKKKRRILREKGALLCEVCGFDFRAIYGLLGDGFAECHHEKPLSTLRPGEKTKLSDLRILCANCHRMVHRSRPWLAVEDLRALIRTIQIPIKSDLGFGL